MTAETHVALASGGMESAAAARESIVNGPAKMLVYLDTGTGIEANREYLEDLADYLGVQLWTLRTHESFEEKVREHGFPGPSRHGIMYQSLKERQLDRLATVCGGALHLWTGVRSLESDRRMANVEETQEARRWTWHAPIHDWTTRDVREYVDEHDIPENPIWTALGRSGDCFCGCFGTREELIDLEAAGHDDHADWLRNLETEVETDDETRRWAWASMAETEQRAERADGRDMTLCAACGVPEPVADGGTVGEEVRSGGGGE